MFERIILVANLDKKRKKDFSAYQCTQFTSKLNPNFTNQNTYLNTTVST